MTKWDWHPKWLLIVSRLFANELMQSHIHKRAQKPSQQGQDVGTTTIYEQPQPLV